MFKKAISVMLVLVMVTLVGCSAATTTATTAAPAATTAAAAETTAAAGGSEPYTIVVMPKLIGIPYFNRSQTGAEQAGKDLGVNVIYNGPSVGDAAQQVQMIEDYITQGVDAICVAPNDAAAMTPVLQKAKEAGIKVLDWDTPADYLQNRIIFKIKNSLVNIELFTARL